MDGEEYVNFPSRLRRTIVSEYAGTQRTNSKLGDVISAHLRCERGFQIPPECYFWHQLIEVDDLRSPEDMQRHLHESLTRVLAHDTRIIQERYRVLRVLWRMWSFRLDYFEGSV